MNPEAVAGKYLEKHGSKSTVLATIQDDIKKPEVSKIVIRKLLSAREILNSLQ